MDRFLFADDVAAAQTWDLVTWCTQHGATEFTVEELGLQGHPTPFLDRFDADMQAFRLADEHRPRMSGRSKADLVRKTELWGLSSASVAVLQRYFVEGLFMYPTSEWEEGCLEDPIFYRNGQIMFGIVTHEREGILTLSEFEHSEVAALGICSRERPEWI